MDKVLSSEESDVGSIPILGTIGKLVELIRLSKYKG